VAYIDNNFIDDLLNQADIVQIINKRIPLNKTGKDYRAPCPFHQGKNKNFAVSSDKQFYHCFKCDASGNVVKFVQDYDHLDFPEAIEVIAQEMGIAVIYDTKNNTQVKKNINEPYYDLIAQVNIFYQKQLKEHFAKDRVINYIKGRSISEQIAKRFELGFAPPGWDNLLKGFQDKVSTLETIGLVVEKQETNKIYDRFRDRLLFPIHNRKGQVVGFGGRVLNNDDKPKYLNSPETPIFHKQYELYGLYQARKFSKKLDTILVVEGYMDVVSLHQQEITNVVATLGTATSEHHLKILTQTTKNIIFCFDGDDAGRKAAWRALETTLPLIKSDLKILFLFLPNGEDPDTYVQKYGKKKFLEKANKSSPLSIFLFEHLKKELDFDTVEGKAQFLEQSIKYIQTINDVLYKQQIKISLAQLVGQKDEQIELLFNTIKPKYSSTPPSFEGFSEFTPPIIKREAPVTAKNNLTRAISLVLNFPIIVENIEFSNIKKTPKTDVLLELLTSAQFKPTITKSELIEPFKNNKVFNRLQQLTNIIACDNAKDAQKELVEILGLLEQKNLKQLIQQLKNKHDKTDEEVKQLISLIRESKG
jgi:DNA primase